MNYPKVLKDLALKIPIVSKRLRKYYEIVYDSGHYRPGHFYSPIPSLDEVRKDRERIFSTTPPKDIDLNTDYQLLLLDRFREYYKEYPYLDKNSGASFRYRKEGAAYKFSDSVFLFCMLRHFKPSKIIEIGLGYSSMEMIDINEKYFGFKTHQVFIEPYADRIFLDQLERCRELRYLMIEQPVQKVSPELFGTLEANDVLFIDSTHVAKTGSDLNYLLFEVLPELKSGVIIHFHDIFYPFEYPEHWIFQHRIFWNELYLLRAFLMNNQRFEILAFNTYLQHINRDWFAENMPFCLKGEGDDGSIWLRKK
jgi:hypothetical protein